MSQAAYIHPACGLQVALDIKGIMQALHSAGSATRSSTTCDFCGKLADLTNQKAVTKTQVVLQVSEAAFLDGGGGKVAVSVWQSAHLALARTQVGTGVAVVGCTATMDNGQVKLSIWPSAHVCTDGAQAAGLTGLDASAASAETLTATFSPGQDLAELLAGGLPPRPVLWRWVRQLRRGRRSHSRSNAACWSPRWRRTHLDPERAPFYQELPASGPDRRCGCRCRARRCAVFVWLLH